MVQLGEGVAPPAAELEQDPEDEDVERLKLRISLFFDGTLNNRVNTRERLGGSWHYRRYQGATSWENDLSNVARLEEHVRPSSGYDHSAALYIEGIGTRDRRGDSLVGAALGTGITGVVAKARKGLRWVEQLVRETLTAEQEIERLSIDTFGFSRGAAAARYFVHIFREALRNDAIVGVPVQCYDVRFVGLFDTVSSHGMNHEDDVRELELDAIQHADYVYQLAAADEYRENFALTNIDSAASGRQIYLPGAHSDVGGGYVDGAGEQKAIARGSRARMEQLADKLVHEGWCERDQLSIETPLTAYLSIHSALTVRTLNVDRPRLSNHYSYIPLHLMADAAAEHGEININSDVKTQYRLSGEMAEAKRRIDASSGGHSSPATWAGQPWRSLRGQHLHWSSGDSIGMGPRFVGDQVRRRVLRG